MEPCQEYEALISAAVDGEATEAERRALMEHLSRCEGCREAYTQSLLLQEAFSQWEEEAPQGFTEAVMEQVRREPRQQKARRSRRRWISLAAAAACLALIVVGFRVSETLRPAAVSPVDGDTALSEDADTPALARAQGGTDTDGSTPEKVQDPTPKVNDAVTQYETGKMDTTPQPSETTPEQSEETPEQNGAEGQGIPPISTFSGNAPVMTVTCGDAGLLTWMEENIPQEGTALDGEVTWVISAADWMKLEVRLVNGGCVYETDGEKTSDQITDGDLVQVIYRPETDA